MDWENEILFIIKYISIEGDSFVCRTTTAFVKYLVYKSIIRMLLIAHYLIITTTQKISFANSESDV